MKKTVVLFILGIIHYSSSIQAEIPVVEREVLIALYDKTGGKNWTSNTNWLGDIGTECSWSGVSCSDNHVVGLNLNNRGLTGDIPTILGYLKYLKKLDLSNNELSGVIPEALGSGFLTHLTPTPSASSLIRGVGLNLEELYLHNNQLSGEIPTIVVNSRALKILTLHNNKLSGKIYSCYSPEELTALGVSSAVVAGQQAVENKCLGIFGSSSISFFSIEDNNLQTVTLFDNCLTIDTPIPQESIEVETFDLGSQNSCKKESSDKIPLVKTYHDFDITIPLIKVNGQGYKVNLARYHPLNEDSWFWHVSNISAVTSSTVPIGEPPVIYDTALSKLTFAKLYLGTEIIGVTLHQYMNPSDPDGFYFQYIP